MQAMAFLAGANSIFDGDKLLTTANNDRNEDLTMFGTLGLRSRPAFLPYASGGASSRNFEQEPSQGGSHRATTGSAEAVGHTSAQAESGGGCCTGPRKQEASGGCCS